MSRQKLTPKGLEILYVLWEAGVSLTASEITERSASLNKNTVNVLLRKLLKEEYIAVDTIVYSGTVLARKYKPLLSHDDYLQQTLTEDVRKTGTQLKGEQLVRALLDQKETKEEKLAEIETLMQLLETLRKEL